MFVRKWNHVSIGLLLKVDVSVIASEGRRLLFTTIYSNILTTTMLHS
jgi:hypothetical protein